MSAKRIADVLAAADASDSDSDGVHEPTHVEEQAQLRAETIAAFHGGVEEEDDLLQLRAKTEDEVAREEAEYRAYLEREVGSIGALIEVDENQVRQREDDSEYGEDKDEEERPMEVEEGQGKKKKRKKKGKGVEKKQTDQEFLMT